jgi:hypothetical protein
MIRNGSLGRRPNNGVEPTRLSWLVAGGRLGLPPGLQANALRPARRAAHAYPLARSIVAMDSPA